MPFISPKSPVEAPAVKSPPPPAPKQTDSGIETPNDAEPESKGFSLHVTVHIAPENVDNFLAAFKTIFDVVSAEPECVFFEVYRAPDQPGKLSWVENWYAITCHHKFLQKERICACTNQIIGPKMHNGLCRLVSAPFP